MNKKTLLASAILFSISAQVSADEVNTSKYWTNYVESRAENSDLMRPERHEADGFIPPNFAYSGYKRGDVQLPDIERFKSYKVFNVKDFGAVPDDNLSDKKAFQQMAKAVSEYVSGGELGAIYYIPAGRFIVNAQEDNQAINPSDKAQVSNEQIIKINGSNVLVKGDGVDKTILAMQQHMYPVSPKQKWSTPYLIHVGAAKESFETDIVTSVTESVIRDTTFELSVADSSQFKVGDYVELEGNISNKERIAEAIAPYKFELDKKGKPLWKMLAANLHKIEKHRITAISGNTLTFDVPVAHNIVADDAWQVRKINPAVNVGVQGITFEGSWDGDFVHHKNAIHDSGYSFLRMARASDSWIKNVKLNSFNQGIQLINSFNCTIQDVELGGNPGHIAVSILYGNHNMVKDINDAAHTWHAPGLSKYSTHNVNLRTRFSEKMGLDLHGAQSMNNLFDNIKGGFEQGHWGAAVKDQPNHLKGLYIWNAENLGKANKNLYFMSSSGKYGKLILPHLIGLSGNRLEVESQFKYMISAKQNKWADYRKFPKRNIPQAYIESNGTPVYPQSLYEAQLEYRRSLEK